MNDDEDDNELIELPPELVDMLQNHDQYLCRNCGQGVSVRKGTAPPPCRKCGFTNFEGIEEITQ